MGNERANHMKSPIVFRASFEQPKGPLNPSGWKIPGPVYLEIYQAKVSPPQWRTRGLVGRSDFARITPQSSPATLKAQILGVFFERQLSDWAAFDGSMSPARPLASSDWATDASGKVYVTESYRKLRLEQRDTEMNTRIHEAAEKARKAKVQP